MWENTSSGTPEALIKLLSIKEFSRVGEKGGPAGAKTCHFIINATKRDRD